MRRIAGLLLIASCIVGFATPAHASAGPVIGIWPQNYNGTGNNAPKSFVQIRNASGITIPYFRSRQNAGQFNVNLATSDARAAAADGLSVGLNIQPKFGTGADRTPIKYVDITQQIQSQSGPYYDWLVGYANEIKALPTYGVVPNYVQFHSEANVQMRSPSAQPWMGSTPWTSGNTPPMTYPALAAEYVTCYIAIHNLFQQLGVTEKIYWQIVLSQGAYAGNQGGAAIWFPSNPSLYDYVGVDAYYKLAKTDQSRAWLSPTQAFNAALTFARARGKQLWIDEVGADEGGPNGDPNAKGAWFGDLDTYLETNLNDIAGVVFSNAADGGDWYLDSIYPTGANNDARSTPFFSGTSWTGWSTAVADLAAARYARALTVSMDGNGTGGVTSDVGGIDCPGTCTANVHAGDVVHLTAAAEPGSVFTGWSGDCSGASCTLSIDADHHVTATFQPARSLTVSTDGSGTGSVSSDVGGIDCPATTCSTGGLLDGSHVILTATPDPGSAFAGWSGGGCVGPSSTCDVPVNGDTSVTATFGSSRDLSVSIGGTAGGSVTSSPAGLSCPNTCTGSFANGNVVSLHADPDDDALFTGWSSGDPGFDCAGKGDCTLTMDQGRNVTATFAKAWDLHVQRVGAQPGTVTADVGAIDCGATCDDLLSDGTTVTLTAADGAHSVFDGWGGDCTGMGTCVVTMDHAHSVIANYDPILHRLNVALVGAGSGTVTSDLAGIDCPDASCVHDYVESAIVTLHAEPEPASSVFSGWSGAGCSGSGDCVVSMDAARSVTATFGVARHVLTIGTSGSGAGSITSADGTIDCPQACGQTYDHGTPVALTATAAAGSVFTGWSGDCAGAATTCDLTMNAARNVTGTFAALRTLSVTNAGAGTGSISSDSGGIACPGTCGASYVHGTPVQLTATAGANSTFTGWSGACTGTGGCQVTMDAAKSVTATFSLLPRTLSVALAGNGAGSVSSTPSGIGCPSTCSSAFDHGTVVQLNATAGANSTFTGWSGACTGAGTCQVTMTAATSVTATFALIPRQLTVTTSGNGTGSVGSSPAGVTCPTSCSASFPHGTIVQLAPSAGANSSFTGWSGACSGTGACQVTMDAAKSVSATFSLVPRQLTVTFAGGGTGSVGSSPAGISCSSTCSASFTHGTLVQLTATPGGGTMTFSGWSGGGCSGTGTCQVSMTAAVAVTATFTKTTTLTDNDQTLAFDGWTTVADARAADGFVRDSNVKNDTLTWKSPPTTSITWVTRVGPDQGKASVTIDGNAKGTFDLYQATRAVKNLPFSGLSNKAHTVVVTVLHTKNAASTGYNVQLDSFVVGTATRSSDPAIAYDGWASTAQGAATNGTYRSSSKADATLTVRFSGTSIDWKGALGPAFGKASVRIDGTSQGTFDLYKVAPISWQTIKSFTGLSAGTHTLVITVLGTKNTKSTGRTVVVDGFVVRG
jgi:hypothetical protein